MVADYQDPPSVYMSVIVTGRELTWVILKTFLETPRSPWRSSIVNAIVEPVPLNL